MNTTSHQSALSDPLHDLARRVRLKRWLAKLHRLAWLLAATIMVVFLVDWLVGLHTLGLRVALSGTLLAAIVLAIADWCAAWLSRLDRLGLAHLVEKHYPDLAERLVTLVQLKSDDANPAFVAMLKAETEQRFAHVDPVVACPLNRERKAWLITGPILAAVFIGICFVPVLRSFSERFVGAWWAPLAPFAIEVNHGNGYALRGGTYSVGAIIRRLDPSAEMPESGRLICEDDAGVRTEMPIDLAEPRRILKELYRRLPRHRDRETAASSIFVDLKNLQRPLRCWFEAGDVRSEAIEVRLIEPPEFAGKPSLLVEPPAYARKNTAAFDAFDETNPERADVLRYSRMQFRLPIKDFSGQSSVHVKRLNQSVKGKPLVQTYAVQWTPEGIVEAIASEVGSYQAEVEVKLEHGLSTALPLGQWTVHEDSAPRFTQALRLVGGGAALASNREYRIAPEDALKIQTTVEDNEGLGTIRLEMRVNDGLPTLEKWLDGAGQKKLVIDDWLPLPAMLKQSDHVQFRVHVRDNRHLKKGEVRQAQGEVVPAQDLGPQVTIAPFVIGNEEAWVTLRVDPSIEGFLKVQAEAQRDEVRDVIARIKEKVQSEATEIQQLQSMVHRQSALTPAQGKQAEKLRASNRDIGEDLLAAGERFGADPELAKLAEHFLDIAENEMMKSAAALERFSAKDRPLAEGEKELQSAHDALTQARKKLDKMLDWNKLLAQGRLDQFQLDKLAKRQKELAQRLEKLLADQPMNDAEMEKQIEAIRAEQANIADRTEKMQEENRLVQESMEAMQQIRFERLAKEAQELAMDQRAQRETPPEKMTPEMKGRLEKLAQQQADLAQRAQGFAQQNQGLDVKPAAAAAEALKKPLLDEAIRQQKEHEKRLHEWQGKLAPGTVVNALREQILALVKKQQAIHEDLDRLVKEVDQLDFATLTQRLEKLTARQKDMPAAIAKLPIDPKDDRLQPAQKQAQETARQAAEFIAQENAAGVGKAHPQMKKTQQELETLADLMPNNLPIDRKEIKDPAVRAKLDQVEAFAKEQEKLRAETERLRSDALKGGSGAGKNPLKEKTDKLAAELMELVQKAGNPETKSMAKESAQTLEEAKKAMDAGQAMKAKGDAEQAKMLDEEAAKKLDLLAKQLAKLTQDQALKGPPKMDAQKTAEALKEGANQMRKAEKDLPALPKDAQDAMKSAAKSLQQAAQQAGKQATSRLPSAARNPPSSASAPSTGSFPGSRPKELKLETFQGKAWGELPGELKTQMLQDARTRFGDDYAEMIQRYFESLADSPGTRKK